MAVYVGIDVSKARLDVYVHPGAGVNSFDNTTAGRQALVAWLRPHGAARVLLKATRGFEQGAVDALYAAGLPVTRINPRQARDFAKSTGQLAKTDALDAHILALMATAGDLLRLQLYTPEAAWRRELAERQRAHMHLRELLSREQQFLAISTDKAIRRGTRARLRMLERHLAAIDAATAQTVEQQPALAPLATVKGVGPVTQAMLACLVPELGRLSGKAVAKLVGVAPLNHGRGTVRGARSI